MDLSAALTPYERKFAHQAAEELGLKHESFGAGEQRRLRISSPEWPVTLRSHAGGQSFTSSWRSCHMIRSQVSMWSQAKMSSVGIRRWRVLAQRGQQRSCTWGGLGG